MPAASQVASMPSPRGGPLARLAGRWKILAAVTAVAGVLALAAGLMGKTTFTSEARIVLVPRTPAEAPVLTDHLKAMQAPDVLRRVADDLGLATRPGFSAAEPPGLSAAERAAAAVARRLAVAAVDARTIAIRVSAEDRELAAAIANAVARTYQDRLAQLSALEARRPEHQLKAKLAALAMQLAEMEAGLAAAGASPPPAARLSPSDERKLAELVAAEAKAAADLAEAQSRAKAARDLIQRGQGEALPEAQRSPQVQRLVQERLRLEAEIAKASTSLREGHPVMKQLRAEVAATGRQIGEEVRRLIEPMDREAALSGERLAALRTGIAALAAKPVEPPQPDLTQLRAAEAALAAKRAEIEQTQKELAEVTTRAARLPVPATAEIVARAEPAARANGPGPLALLAVSMLGALLLASCGFIARDLVAGARSDRPARPKPEAHDAAANPPPASLDAPVHAAAPSGQVETLVDLANRLIAKRVSKQGLRTLIAGAGMSIDVSAEAVDLARTLARAGASVLLVDWSLDAKGVARLIGAEPSPGMAELIEGTSGFVGAIGRVPGSTAQFVASGDNLFSASGRGEVDRLNMVLDTFDEIYEHIIVAARFHAARDLFETIEGRFDVGVLVGEPRGKAPPAGIGRAFLGFEVEDLEVIRLSGQDTSARRGAKAVGKAA